MIEIKIDRPKFEYDIHALVKSFYPEEEVLVSENVTAPLFEINYGEDSITFKENKGAFFKKVPIPRDIERPEEKNAVKRLVYSALSQYTHKTLPWGDLSGIRPTRIPMKKLDEGLSDEEILEYMKEVYLISDEKGRLSIDIAKREREVLKPINFTEGYSIYIGIPFCPSTCLYCSFTSNPIFKYKDRVQSYLECIGKELEFTAMNRQGKTLDTIYIGGGTPTTLSADELEVLFSLIEKYYDVTTLKEFTVEAGRADSITKDRLRVMKAHHVTRISVNPQTMNEETLKLIGRRHTTEDVERAFNDAKEAGFSNINMDIILGLPGEGINEVRHTLEEIKKLSPDSLTVHSLAIKRASKMHEWIEANGYETMINTAETMKLAESAAYDMGLKPYYLYRQKDMAGNYENTGYAREGCFGIYNILIMEELQPIIAMGAGSVSKVISKEGRMVRDDNIKDVDLYIEKIDEMIERKRKLFDME